jgi:hypothetical protein
VATRLRSALLILLAAGALAPAAGGDEGEAEAPARSVPAQGEPVALGSDEAALRAAFGDALREQKVEVPASLTEQILALGRRGSDDAATPPAEPFAGQRRLVRELSGGDVRRVEYELRDGRVYRVRWRLAPRFEEPVLSAAVAKLAARLGEPVYDQTLEPRFGSARSELRRVGWKRDGRVLELRQIHPRTGGPVYLTLSDLATLQGIAEAGNVALPEPERSESWWQRPQREARLPTTQQVAELAAALDAVAAGLPF